MKNINRRESPRIEIQLRCHVTSPSAWPLSSMYTENISRNGVLINWQHNDASIELPHPGQILTVEVELPAHHGFGQKCIHCQGTVVRVLHPESGMARVALNVNYMDFRSFGNGVAVMESAQAAVGNWMA